MRGEFMEDHEIISVLEITDEYLEAEFEGYDPVDIDFSKIVATSPSISSVGSYNSSFGGCCCTIQSSSEVCGGSGFLPTAVECTGPGGA
jgi:hypothetical protein